MGLCQSDHSNTPESTGIVGSTFINGRHVMIFDGTALIPLHDRESNQNAVIEVDMKHRNVKILRGVGGSITHRFINNSRKKKKADEVLIEVESDGEIKENSFSL